MHDLLQTTEKCKCSIVIGELMAGHRLKRQIHGSSGNEFLGFRQGVQNRSILPDAKLGQSQGAQKCAVAGLPKTDGLHDAMGQAKGHGRMERLADHRPGCVAGEDSPSCGISGRVSFPRSPVSEVFMTDLAASLRSIHWALGAVDCPKARHLCHGSLSSMFR